MTNEQCLHENRNSLVILGGHQMGHEMSELDTIYQYDPVTEDWVLRDETLLGARGSFGMVLVDENSLNC